VADRALMRGALAVRGISKSYRGHEAVRDVTLDIAPGELVTLLGPSGCGKTTLLRLVAGFERPDTGTLAISGSDVTAVPPYKRPVNTVFQHYALFPHRSVAGNVAFGLEMRGTPAPQIAAKVAQALALVRLDGFGERAVSELSGGQKQRVALARALIANPRVLILDEATSNLDAESEAAVQGALARIMEGRTTLIVAHRLSTVRDADRILVIEGSKIVESGRHDELMARRGTYHRLVEHQLIADHRVAS